MKKDVMISKKGYAAPKARIINITTQHLLADSSKYPVDPDEGTDDNWSNRRIGNVSDEIWR